MRAVALSLALLCVGCVNPASAPTTETLPQQSSTYAPVVVALLDTGANPYLEIFRDSTIDVEFTGAIEVGLSAEGSIAERRKHDETLRNSLSPRTLYHYEGTRLLGISFREKQPSEGYTIDNFGHGTATSYLAAREAPLALIVVVQVEPNVCEDRMSCSIPPSAVEALEWVAAQPWIDIISLSLGVIGNPPDSSAHDSTAEAWVAASRSAAGAGKSIIAGSGNYVVPPVGAPIAGPPWVMAVGGVDSQSGGESWVASKGIDIAANFSELVPDISGEEAWTAGTSIATPIVSGTLANALGLLRASNAQVDASALRAAANATAVYFAPTDYRPGLPGREPLPDDVLNHQTIPVLLQSQMGWGYIDGSFAPEIARRVLENDLEPPPEKQQAIIFQSRWQQAREDYWANAPR